MKTLDKTMGGRLRDARQAAGLSERDLARSIGVSYQAIQQWEGDRTLPKARHIPMLEDQLGLAAGTVGGWVRHSPIYLATLRDASIPGYLSRQRHRLSTLVPHTSHLAPSSPLPAAA